MTRSRTPEYIINSWVAEIIQNSGWCTAKAERTRTVYGKSGKRPDIIVSVNNQATIIELETNKNNLEREVNDRLNIKLEEGNITPSAIIGVLFPKDIAFTSDKSDFCTKFKESKLRYFINYGKERFPNSGYLEGSIIDVITAIRLSIIPKETIKEYIRIIQRQIRAIGSILENTTELTKQEISTLFGYTRDENTLYGMSDKQIGYMAALMIINAGVFYEELSRYMKIKSLSSVGEIPGKPTKTNIMTAMSDILEISYAPIFKITIEILNVISSRQAGQIIKVMLNTIDQVLKLGIHNSVDVYGVLYQDDLIERKKSASFYTRPEAATLLASLVLPNPNDKIWRDGSKIKQLKIGDFACGTGMLLTAAYNHIIYSHNDNESSSMMHPDIMRDVLWGFDIMPTATHLTVSNLASIYPNKIFQESRIYQMPIGIRMPSKRSELYSLGSLDLIREVDMEEKIMAIEVQSLFEDARSGKRHGQEKDSLNSIRLKSKSFDYIMMNPPYVRATNHGSGRTDPVPPFSIFGIPSDIQIKMGKINARLFSGFESHGNAGLASYFLSIANQKLKDSSSMGLILPATIISGESWNDIRKLLNKSYDGVTIIMLRRLDAKEATFSSSTGMEEIILVAKKRKTKHPRIKFVLLNKLPSSNLEGLEVAKLIQNTSPNKLERYVGGTSLVLGDQDIGDVIDCPVEKEQWMLSSTSSIFLLQFVYKIIKGKIGIKMTTIDSLGEMGKYHLDITGSKDDGSPRGPFLKIKYTPQKKYHSLWNNNNNTQKTIKVNPDSTLEVKPDTTRHVNTVWKTRTRLHINMQVRYTSQRLIAAYTEERTVGGSSWPNIILNKKKHEKAITVWLNSLFGILTHWFVSGSQQLERGFLTISSTKLLPVPNFDKMDEKIIPKLNKLFDNYSHKELLPINMIDQDQTRQEIDQQIIEIMNLKIKNIKEIYTWLIHERRLGRKNLT